MTNELYKDFEPFGRITNREPIGLGFETEQVQRAAKFFIAKYLPEVKKQVEQNWALRDKEYAEFAEAIYNPLVIPEVPKQNIFLGTKPSLIEAPLDLFPNITIYCHNFKPATVQQSDEFETIEGTLIIEIMCNSVSVQKEQAHKLVGFKAEEELDSKLQRLSDVVHMCIRKNPSLGGAIIGPIARPPTVIQSLPYVRNEITANIFMFQGRQFQYTILKNSQ